MITNTEGQLHVGYMDGSEWKWVKVWNGLICRSKSQKLVTKWMESAQIASTPPPGRTCKLLPGPPGGSRQALTLPHLQNILPHMLFCHRLPTHTGARPVWLQTPGQYKLPFLGVFARWGLWLISNDAQRRRWAGSAKTGCEWAPLNRWKDTV